MTGDKFSLYISGRSSQLPGQQWGQMLSQPAFRRVTFLQLLYNCFGKATQDFHTKKNTFLFLKAGAIQTHLQHSCSGEKKIIMKENEMKSLITTCFQGEKSNHLVSYQLLTLATDATLTYCTFGKVWLKCSEQYQKCLYYLSVRM